MEHDVLSKSVLSWAILGTEKCGSLQCSLFELAFVIGTLFMSFGTIVCVICLT